VADVLTETEHSHRTNGSGPDHAEPTRRTKPLTPQQKKVLRVALLIHVIVTFFTWRDLGRRPAAAVRGPKVVWQVAAALNTSGSLAYWLFGRRPAS
jgi:hypothetical protein